MKKSELIAALQEIEGHEIEGDPEVYIRQKYGLLEVGEINIDEDGDIVISG